MNVITVTSHEPGDYLHTEQKLELVEEGSGSRYELFFRGTNDGSSAVGEISLFLPLSNLRGIQANGEFCVVTLSSPQSAEEAASRRKKLEGFRLNADPIQVKK